jgi:hypothetical protein
VAFFDDRQENVDAAAGVGMRAFRTKGVEEVRAAIESLSRSA